MINLHKRMLPTSGSNQQPPGLQSDVHPTEPQKPALLLLCECLDLFDFLLLLWEGKEEDLEEEEEEEDLCLLLFFDSCFVLGWSLLLSLFWDVCLSGDCQMLVGRSIITLGSNMALKSGSNGNNTCILLGLLEFWGSFDNECSELLGVWLDNWYSVPIDCCLMTGAW